LGGAGFRFLQESRDNLNEPSGGLGRQARALGGDMRAGAGLVVGDRFQIVGVAKKRPQLIINARIVSYQPAELAPYPGMPFVDAPGGLEDEGLRSMKPGEVRRASGGF
jgi:hypothetical protein